MSSFTLIDTESFFVGLWSWSADELHFVFSYDSGFYNPTFLKVRPPICRITAAMLGCPNKWDLFMVYSVTEFEPTTSRL